MVLSVVSVRDVCDDCHGNGDVDVVKHVPLAYVGDVVGIDTVDDAGDVYPGDGLHESMTDGIDVTTI